MGRQPTLNDGESSEFDAQTGNLNWRKNIILNKTKNLSFTPFNKISSISENQNKLQFYYGTDQQRRIMQTRDLSSNALLKEKFYGSQYEKEVDYTTNTTRQWHYISGGDGLSAVYIKTNETGQLYFVAKDHLGSIIGLYNTIGTLVEEYSYDAWGRRRNPNTWHYSNIQLPTLTKRGYTGHEHLDEFGLINMNGRLYDPLLGRMLSPDNYVQGSTGTQNFNRYSYCLNNPLTYTDPDGEIPILIPIIYAAINVGVDLLINKGKMNFGEILASAAMGAIGGYLGGANITGTTMQIAANAAISASFSQVSRLMPSIPIYQSENFSLGYSPTFGFGSHGFNLGWSMNASGKVGDFSFSGSIGIGENSGMSSLKEAAGSSNYLNVGAQIAYEHQSTNYGFGYSYNKFTGNTAQGVGAIHLQIGDFGLRFDEDFIGDGKDRFRTGGLLTTYKINDDLTLAFGGSMMTGQAGGGKLDYGNPNIDKKSRTGEIVGTHDDCTETMFDIRGGTMYFGVIYKGQTFLAGSNSEKRLHKIQNFIHRYLTPQTPYFFDRELGRGFYSYYGGFHPNYLFY
jgi:RHS repeat-associated protein